MYNGEKRLVEFPDLSRKWRNLYESRNGFSILFGGTLYLVEDMNETTEKGTDLVKIKDEDINLFYRRNPNLFRFED